MGNIISTLTGQPISLFEDDGQTYRSTYAILQDIAEVWGTISDKNQAALLETLAGKTRANELAAVLSNFKTAQEVIEATSNSAGNAMEEFEKATDGVSYKINRLQQTFVGFSQNVISSDLFKFSIDSLTNILGLIDKITSASGGLGTALGVALGYSTLRNNELTSLKKLISLEGFNNEFSGKIKNGFFNLFVPDELSNKLEKITEEINTTNLSAEQLKTTFGKTSTAVSKYIDSVGNANVTTEGLSNALGVATVKQKALEIATKATNVALNMGIGLLVGIGINWAIKLIDELIVTQEELEEKVQQSKTAYDDTTSSLESVNSELESNKKRIKELKKLGTLTYVEQSELDKLNKANEALETQQKLLQAEQNNNARQLAEDTLNASKKYGNLDISAIDMYDKVLKGGKDWTKTNLLDSTDVIAAHLVKFKQLNDQLSEMPKNTQEWQDKLVEVNEQKSKLNEIMSLLTTDMQNYSAELEIINSKDKSKWDSTEKAIVEANDRAEEYYNLILKITDPNSYNQNQFDKIFDNENIEYTKEQLIELSKAGRLNDLDFSSLVNLTEAIKESGLEADESGSKIEKFKEQIEALSRTSEFHIDIFDLANGLDDAKDIFDDRKEDLTNLADLVDALGNSFSLTADEAREFVDIFPELLAQGQITSDGLIKFNKSTIDDFVSGKQKIAKADAEERIKELENAKVTLTALKESAEAQLKIAQSCANGELTLDQAKDQIMSERAKSLTQYLIDLGLDEQNAQAAVLAAQSDNMDEYSRIVGNIGDDVAYNMAAAMASSADATKINIEKMLKSWNVVGTAIAEVSKQVAAASKGKVTFKGVSTTVPKASGVILNNYKSARSNSNFKEADQHQITATKKEIDNIINDIKLDISSYTNAIAGIDTQINLLKAQMNKPLSDYSSGAYKDSSDSSSKKNKSSDSSNTFLQTFDWLSIAIDRLEDQINKLDKTASNTYKTWSTRNKALTDEISNLTDELVLQTAAYNVYMAQANSVDLSSHYKNLVKKGALDIDTITDENLASKIEEFQNWYEKALDTQSKIQELEQSIGDAFVQKFDNVVSIYEEKLNIIDSKANDIETMISLNEAKGMFSSKTYYDQLVAFEKETLSHLENERDELIDTLNKSVENQSVLKYSETWYSLQSQINDVNSAILESTKSLVEFNNEIRDLEWEIFDYLQDSISQITSESNFLLELLEYRKMYDDNGFRTNYGNASLELHGINYNTYMSQANDYLKEIQELDKQYQNDSLNQDYIDRRRELLELQQESILNAENEKDAIKDLIKEGYEAQLNALKDLMDARKAALNAEKDLYDYQKEIAQKTKNIADIKKQIDAYETDDSEENRKTIQELKNQLVEAQEDLDETEYDKYLSDQEAFLDDLYSEFEGWINVRLDDVNGLINDTINTINENSTNVSETIKSVSEDVGYKLSDEISNIINTNSNNINEIENVVENYNSNFTNTMTTVQSTLNLIKENVRVMAEHANKSAAEEVKKQQAQQTKQTAASANTTNVKSTATISSGTNKSTVSGTSGSSSTSSSSSSSNLKSIFAYKKDTYPKSKLQRYTSIVDALKYYDYNSSFSYRKQYYKKLFNKSGYTGSASQNTELLKKFRSIMGYHNGGIVGNLKTIIKDNGDKGLATFEPGEVVLPKTMKDDWTSLINSLPDLNNMIKQSSNYGNIYIQMDLSNVTDYNDFINKLKSDNNFTKYILSTVNSSLTGKLNHNKNRYK